MATKTWSKSSIVKEIKLLEAQGVDLHSPNIRKNYPKLYNAVMEYFHSWFEALKAAEIDPNKYRMLRPKGCWNVTTIPQTLQDRRQRGLSNKAETLQRELPGLLNAGYKIYGSHPAMLKAAGVFEDKIPKWNKPKIIAELKAIKEKGEPIRPRDISRNYPYLYQAIMKLYKRIFFVYIDANLDPDRYGGKWHWDREVAIAYLRFLFEKGPENIRPVNIMNRHSGLHGRVPELFGNYHEFFKAAKVNPGEMKYLGYRSKDRCKEILTRLYTEGMSLDMTSMRSYDASFVQACIRAFDEKYENAIAAIGLDYDDVRRTTKLQNIKGIIFENLVSEVFEKTGRRMERHKHFRFDDELCVPDFVDVASGEWVDVKLYALTPNVQKSLDKYLEYKDRLTVVYLNETRLKKGLNPYRRVVSFTPITFFYHELRDKGETDLIERIEMLRKGIFRHPYLQRSLRELLEGQSDRNRKAILDAIEGEKRRGLVRSPVNLSRAP